MINRHTTLGHHLFEVAIAHPVAAVPPHRPQDDFTRELPTGEDAHGPDYSTPGFLLPQFCNSTFTDTASGALESRPELDKLLDQIRPGDTLVVWRLDRLGRSIRHLINHMDALQQRSIEFKSLQENIDTSSPGGRLVFNIFASLAEFERDLIRERTNAGLQAARARGRTGGRPTALSPDKLRTAKRLYEQREMTVAQIGTVLGVSRSTVYRALSKN